MKNEGENFKRDLSIDGNRISARGRLRGAARVRKLPVGVLWRDPEGARGVRGERKELYKPPETEKGSMKADEGPLEAHKEVHLQGDTPKRGLGSDGMGPKKPLESYRSLEIMERHSFSGSRKTLTSQDSKNSEIIKDQASMVEGSNMYKYHVTDKTNILTSIDRIENKGTNMRSSGANLYTSFKPEIKTRETDSRSKNNENNIKEIVNKNKNDEAINCKKEFVTSSKIDVSERSKIYIPDNYYDAMTSKFKANNLKTFDVFKVNDIDIKNETHLGNRSDKKREDCFGVVDNYDKRDRRNIPKSPYQEIRDKKAEIQSIVYLKKENKTEKLNAKGSLRSEGKNGCRDISQLSDNDKRELKGGLYYYEQSSNKIDKKINDTKKLLSDDEDSFEDNYGRKRSRWSDSNDYDRPLRNDKRSMNILKNHHTCFLKSSMDENKGNHTIFKDKTDNFRKIDDTDRKDLYSQIMTNKIKTTQFRTNYHSKDETMESMIGHTNRRDMTYRTNRDHDRDSVTSLELYNKDKQLITHEIKKRKIKDYYANEVFEMKRGRCIEKKDNKTKIRSQVTVFRRYDSKETSISEDKYQRALRESSRKYKTYNNDKIRNDDYIYEHMNSRINDYSWHENSKKVHHNLWKYESSKRDVENRRDGYYNTKNIDEIEKKDILSNFDNLRNKSVRTDKYRNFKSESHGKIRDRRKEDIHMILEDKRSSKLLLENNIEKRDLDSRIKHFVKKEINKNVKDWRKGSKSIIKENSFKNTLKRDASHREFEDSKNTLASRKNERTMNSKDSSRRDTSKQKDIVKKLQNHKCDWNSKKDESEVNNTDTEKNDILKSKIKTTKTDAMIQDKDAFLIMSHHKVNSNVTKPQEYVRKQNDYNYELRNTRKSSYSNSSILSTRRRRRRLSSHRKSSRTKSITIRSLIRLGGDHNDVHRYKRYCSSSRKSSFASSNSASYDSFNIDLPLISPRSPDDSLKKLSYKEPVIVSANVYLQQLKDTLEKINVAYKSVVSQIPDEKKSPDVALLDIPLPIENSEVLQNIEHVNVKINNQVTNVRRHRLLNHKVHSNSINADKLSSISNSSMCSKIIKSPLFSLNVLSYSKESEKSDSKLRPILPKLTTSRLDFSDIDPQLLKYDLADFFTTNMKCHCVMPNPDQWNNDGIRGCGHGQKCVLRQLKIECFTQRCPTEVLCTNCQFQRIEISHLHTNNVEFYFDISQTLSWKLRTRSTIEKGVLLFEIGGKASYITTEESQEDLDLLINQKIKITVKSDKHSLVYYLKQGSREEANVHIERWLVNGQMRLGVYTRRYIAAKTEIVLFYNKDFLEDFDQVSSEDTTEHILSSLQSFFYESVTKEKLLSLIDQLLFQTDSSSKFQNFLELGGVPVLFSFSVQYLSQNCFDETLFDKLVELLVKVPYEKSASVVCMLGMEKQDLVDQLINIVSLLGSHNHSSFIALHKVKKMLEVSNSCVANDKRGSLLSDSNNLYTLNCRLPNFWCSRECLCDGEARVFFYHKVTKHVQWEMPVYPWESNKDDQADVYDYNRASHVPVTHEEIYYMYLNLNKMYEIKQRKIINKEIKPKPPKELNETQKKELFRKKMTEFIIRLLKPYRDNNCQEGRITSDEDLRYLANKLSQTILLKELKIQNNTCASLEVTTVVENKTKTYVKMYLASRGSTYQRPQPSQNHLKPEVTDKNKICKH